MKKKLLLLVAACMAIIPTSLAYDFSVVVQSGQTLYFTRLSDNTVKVSGASLTGDLVIPAMVTHDNVTYNVTTIGDRAFSGCSGLTSVVIPNSVTTIGSDAFYRCSGLTSVIFNADSCSSAGNGNAPIFQGCNNLTNITFGDNVGIIPSYLCYGCIGLTSVTIPNSVTTIGIYAFNGCSGLTSVTIPNSVTTIGNYAFNGCSGLTSVTIPNSVTSIYYGAFCACSGLTSVIFNADSCIYAGRFPDHIFSGCSNLTSITFGNNVRSIPNYLCYGCSGLTSITIPNSVTTIGEYSFSGCTGLASVTIPNSVTTIGEYSFSGCTGLASVTIPNSVTSIGNYAFSNVRHIEYHGSATGSPWGAISMNGVTDGDFVYSDSTKHYLIAYSGTGGDVTIPSTVDTIGNRAFYNCTGLTSVTIGNSVSSIGYEAFYGCSSLTSVNISNSVTTIGDRAFYNCRDLTSVTIPNSVTSIGNYAFCGCSSLTSVTIPNSVTSIDGGAFSDCTGLTTVTIPNSVTTIGGEAFFNCTGLTSVVIPNSVTTIGYSSFSYCSGLTSVTIPNSVTSISYYAFSECSGLSSVTIPSSVTAIYEDAFLDVRHIEYYGNATGAPWGAISMNGVTDGDFVFSDTTKHYLIAFSGIGGDVTIPSTVDTIGNMAFLGCYGLSSITIPNSVTSIGYMAFDNCSGLTSVTIPNSVTSIGNYAFAGCSGITAVTIPNSVTTIGSDAFYRCSGLTSVIFNADSCISDGSYYSPIFGESNNLTSITFGNNVKRIPGYICRGCSSLTSVTIPNSVTSIGESAFRDCTGLTSVIFNADSCIAAGNHDFRIFYNCSNLTTITFGNNVKRIPSYLCYGCRSLTSVAIPNSVTSIGNEAFCYCSGLTSVTIGNSVTTIGNSAFYGCSGLTSVTIPNSVTSIGNSAFSGCTGLTTIIIPNSVTSIGDYAFYGCSGLDTVYLIPSIAPSLGGSLAFSNNAPGRVFVLYGCAYDNYYNSSSWYSYRYSLLLPQININVNVSSSDLSRGTAAVVLGPHNEIVRCDSTAVVKATPNTGYHFTQWNDGVMDNPRTITLTWDTSLTAHFAPNRYTLTVNASAHGTTAGSGTYNFGDTVTIRAFPEEHCHFTRWGDGITENPRRIRVETNITLTAYFAVDTYTVSVTSSDILRGMVETSGTEFVYGSPCTVTATAYTGYTFAGWSNGVSANPYTFAVTSDVELTALFVEEGDEMYTVTVESADPTMGSVSGGGQALNGGTLTIRAIPNNGYRFCYWNDGNTANPRTVTVTGNATYTAYFESTQGIGDINAAEIKVYATDGCVVVQGAERMAVCLYDITGRLLATKVDDSPIVHFNVQTPGTYLVQVGDLPARKVVVIR